MRRSRRRAFRPAAAVLALGVVVAAAGGVWLLASRLAPPKPTAFGWPATLTTVAGDGERGSADGTRVQARFSDPFAVAIDRHGAIYVADAGDANRIRRIGRDGATTTLPGVFDTPSGLAIDKAGDVIVADTGANAIRKISHEGVVAILAGDGTAGFRDGAAGQARFNGPIGVAVDKAGNVYVADTYNDRIRLITPDGQVKTLAGGSAPGFADGQGVSAAFDTPCGLALDRTGALLIADTGNDAIRRLDKDGRVVTLAHGASDERDGVLRAPVGLAATPDGFLYISSFRHGRIVQMSPTGALRILSGRDAPDPGNAALRLASPAGLALDRSGALYIADPAAYAVRKLSPRRAGEAAASSQITPAPRRWSGRRPFPGRSSPNTPGTRWWAAWARCAATTRVRAATTSTLVSTSMPRWVRPCWRWPTKRSRARCPTGT